MKTRYWALIAAFIVQLLYGLNFTFAKDVIAGGFLKPFGFILVRVAGATLLFWLFSFLGPKEKIERKDKNIIFSLTGLRMDELKKTGRGSVTCFYSSTCCAFKTFVIKPAE